MRGEGGDKAAVGKGSAPRFRHPILGGDGCPLQCTTGESVYSTLFH